MILRNRTKAIMVKDRPGRGENGTITRRIREWGYRGTIRDRSADTRHEARPAVFRKGEGCDIRPSVSRVMWRRERRTGGVRFIGTRRRRASTLLSSGILLNRVRAA